MSLTTRLRSDDNESVYTIGELAEKFAVSLRTLRFYESRGLLSPTHCGRHRRYGHKEADRLAAIIQARKTGFHAEPDSSDGLG
jgi:DNA-binding transcriptional MerR regulator